MGAGQGGANDAFGLKDLTADRRRVARMLVRLACRWPVRKCSSVQLGSLSVTARAWPSTTWKCGRSLGKYAGSVQSLTKKFHISRFPSPSEIKISPFLELDGGY